jgi:hypothetical protein
MTSRAAAVLGLFAAVASGCSSAGSSTVRAAPPADGPSWQVLYRADFDDQGLSSPSMTVMGQAWVGVRCSGDVQDFSVVLDRAGYTRPLAQLTPHQPHLYVALGSDFGIEAHLLGAATCAVEVRVSPHARSSVAHGA